MTSLSVTVSYLKHRDSDLQLHKIRRSRPVTGSEAPGSGSGNTDTLVVFFGWLGAKPNHLKLYFELYHQKNLDVLYIPGNVKHFVWPPSVKDFSKSLIGFIINNGELACYKSFLIHGVSIGAYVFICCLMAAYENQTLLFPFIERIRGVILDSPTYGSFERMRQGVAQGLAKNVIVQTLIPKLLSVYLYFTWTYTVKFFEKAMHFLEERPLNVPYLMYISHNDPMCDAEVISKMATNWRENLSVPVMTRFWDKSVHAAHLKYHPKEYVETLKQFLAMYSQRLNELKSDIRLKSKL